MTDHTCSEAAGGVRFRHTQSKQFATYMLSLSREHSRPLRTSFDPIDIPRLLPRIILSDLGADGIYTYRLLGTELLSFMGHDPTGQPVTAGVGVQAAGPIQAAMDLMMAHPCGLRCVTSFAVAAVQVALLEYVSFPLAGVSPPQQIRHAAILERAAWMDETRPAKAHHMEEIEGVDLGAGVADFSAISW